MSDALVLRRDLDERTLDIAPIMLWASVSIHGEGGMSRTHWRDETDGEAVFHRLPLLNNARDRSTVRHSHSL